MYPGWFPDAVNNSTTHPSRNARHGSQDTQRVSDPSSGSMDFLFSGNTNLPNQLSEGSPYGLPSSQILSSDPIDTVSVAPNYCHVNSTLVNRVPDSNNCTPCHPHQVDTISNACPGERLLHWVENARGQNTPESVSRLVLLSIRKVAILRSGPTGLNAPESVDSLVRLPNDQAADFRVGPTGYGPVLDPNAQPARSQVGPTGYVNSNYGEVNPCVSVLFPPQSASYENPNSGQASSAAFKGHRNNQHNSTNFQLPKQAVHEKNSRPCQRSPPMSSGQWNMTEREIYKVRHLLLRLWHASSCSFKREKCKVPLCQETMRLLQHIQNCNDKSCSCVRLKQWNNHFRTCRGRCPICKPVYLASFNSNSFGVENVSISTKRTHSAPYANDSEVMNPPSKYCKIDDTAPIVMDREACINPLNEVIQKFKENFEAMVSIEKESDIQPTIAESISLQHRHQGEQLCTTITVPLTARMSQDTSFPSQITPEQVTENDLRQKGSSNQGVENGIVDVDLDTERIPHHDTNRVEDTDDPNEASQVTCMFLKTETEVIVLDEEDSGDRLEKIKKKDREIVDPGVGDIEKGACTSPLVEEKASVLCEHEVEKILVPDITLSDTRVSNDTSLLPVAPPDQVMKNCPRLSPCSDQSKVKEDINQGAESCRNQVMLYSMDKISSEITKEVDIERTSVQCEQQVECQIHAKDDMVKAVELTHSADHLNQTMLRHNGASLIYSFTPEQIRDHILYLRQCSYQAKGTTNAERLNDGSVDEICCSLCGLGELNFEILVCSKCYVSISRNDMYFFNRNVDAADGDNAVFYCVSCQKAYKFNGLEKAKNSGNTAPNEPWVKCDKCNDWQHQICALFNNEKNEGDQAEYICPKCYLSEIGSINHKTMAHGEILEAKHLPRTKLSDHIEERLSRRLEEDKQKQADKFEKNINEVPVAEDLVVRVVSSVNKKVKVPDSILEVLPKDGYPKEFPYKSKVILLFQKIGGADVCLFAVYAQEYGLQCPYPNRGRVYLSYIDSVNYFRPRIQAANEEPLRTFVYHEILIGYLDYCKKRDFISFHIWVYPPKRKQDFIFHSHPMEQKTITKSKLQTWYQTLIHKAKEENIVVDSTTVYDKYIKAKGCKKSNLFAEQLPYFDGDYWPSKVERILGKNAKEFNYNSTVALLQEIFMGQQKNKHIIIQLQHDYECYKEHPLHKKRHEPTDSVNMEGIHLMNHDMVGVAEYLAKAMDEDENISSRILNTRTDFLDFCQRNNHQFDSLRRAQHSTMIIVYHLLKDYAAEVT